MKKSYLIILFSFLLIFTSSCLANFNVQPREISIIMNENFIYGNTTKMIIITNNNDENINISWYLDNPTQDLIRENKTLIPSLSWISIEPKWQIIAPFGSARFYIILKIPEEKENFNQHWETWPVFKQEETQFFNWEHAVRLYIDTPEKFPNELSKEKDIFSILNENSIIYSVIVICVIIVFSVFIVKIKNKKS